MWWRCTDEGCGPTGSRSPAQASLISYHTSGAVPGYPFPAWHLASVPGVCTHVRTCAISAPVQLNALTQGRNTTEQLVSELATKTKELQVGLSGTFMLSFNESCWGLNVGWVESHTHECSRTSLGWCVSMGGNVALENLQIDEEELGTLGHGACTESEKRG